MPSQDWWIVFKTKKEGSGVSDTTKDLGELKKGLGGAIEGFTGMSLGSLSVAGALAGVGVEMKKAVDFTLEYTDQVRDLSRVSGASAEETSKLIKTADDLKVGYSTLEAAAKKLAKEGIALTTEELAKAADKYLSYSDAGARAEYVNKTFGKSGQEMTKILEMGGDALRQMAAEQSGNLILTQDSLDKAREYEKAQNELNDTMDGFKVVVGNAVIPILTKLVTGINDAITYGDRMKNTFTNTAKSATNMTTTFAQFKAKLKETGYEFDSMGNVIVRNGDYMGHAVYTVVQSAADLSTQFQQLSADTIANGLEDEKLTRGKEKAALAIQTEANATEVLKSSMSNLKIEMAGAVGKENADYIKSYNTLNGELQDTQSKMSELLKIKGPWTPQQQADYDGLLSAQDALKTKIAETEESHRKAMAQFVLDNMIAKMSIDGPLTQAETDFALDYAVKQGLVDQATKTSIDQVDGYIDTLANDVPPSYDGWKKYQDDINGKLDDADSKIGTVKTDLASIKDKTITITVKKVAYGSEDPGTDVSPGPDDTNPGKGAFASGGSFVIPAGYGYEGYPLGPGKTASGGETVTVTPAGRGGAGISITGPVYINNGMDLESFKRMLMTALR